MDEVKDIRDKARAIGMYTRQAQNTEAERQACEIRLRAERKCGELLNVREMAKGTRGQLAGARVTRGPEIAPPLADLGISYDQSSQWQKLAAIPDEEFEADLKDSMWRPTTSGMIDRREARERGPLPRQVVDDGALWLWGRLQNFERNGLLERARLMRGPVLQPCMRVLCKCGSPVERAA